MLLRKKLFSSLFYPVLNLSEIKVALLDTLSKALTWDVYSAAQPVERKSATGQSPHHQTNQRMPDLLH